MLEAGMVLEANKFLIRYHYIYKFKNYTKAAENFYMPSSERNMRYAVSQLQDIYGVQLVNTDGNKLDFTFLGHLLGEYSQKIFSQNLEIASVIDRINMKEIRFASTFDFYKYYIGPVFDRFIKDNPDVRVQIIKTNQSDAQERLAKREIDFVIGTIPLNKNPDFVYDEVEDGKMLLAYRPEDREKFCGINSLKELTAFKGAMNDPSAAFYENFVASIANAEVELRILYETTDYGSLIKLLTDKIADYAIVGNYEKTEGIEFKDISGLFLPVKIAFIYRNGENPTKSIKELIAVFGKVKIKPVEVELK